MPPVSSTRQPALILAMRPAFAASTPACQHTSQISSSGSSHFRFLHSMQVAFLRLSYFGLRMSSHTVQPFHFAASPSDGIQSTL